MKNVDRFQKMDINVCEAEGRTYEILSLLG